MRLVPAARHRVEYILLARDDMWRSSKGKKCGFVLDTMADRLDTGRLCMML